jgi:hypothetical protein
MRYKQQNHKGEYSISGVYAVIEDDLRSDIRSLKITESQVINIAIFTRVINLYFKYWFEAIINENAMMKLYNKLGYLFVIKTLCIRYNPTKTYFVVENGERIKKIKEIKLKEGYFPFVFWDSGKLWRMFKFEPANKWKKMIYHNFFDLNHDYQRMNLENYGRKGSPSYVQQMK